MSARAYITKETHAMSMKLISALASVLAAVFFLTISDARAAEATVKSLGGEKTLTETNSAPALYDITEKGRQERSFRQQPPLIPHRIDKYEIDLKVNQCLRCHDWPYNVQEKAPKVSETHYVDREGHRLDKIAGTRWFCTQCHAPQADAKPLVNNTFTDTTKAR